MSCDGLRGRAALITGASSGIGRGVAVAFARQGARVAVNYPDPAERPAAEAFGRIINTASQLAYKGSPGLTHYTAAKGAIIAMTRSLALEVGARDVTVNCVAPGATQTPILDDVPRELIEQIRQSIPLGRLAEVDDIVPTYVFLASDEARHYQGQCLSPNGGDVFL